MTKYLDGQKVEVEYKYGDITLTEKLTVAIYYYIGTGRPAVRLIESATHAPYASLTVNDPTIELKPGQTILKTWDGNYNWLKDLIKKLDCFKIVDFEFIGYAIGIVVELKPGWEWHQYPPKGAEK